ncbi:tryptophan ABC transporter substrate-binding protein [Lactobacillus sp. ESL0731]|uniref:tryptophan ABC transporter substrate-binding protein n=1 Tax=unclassified Lactobacillus TaxID=2620435 RepID=UPI0023F9BC9C|nr:MULTISPECIES: tryptophan ABC transporter substrate-binding protein [unclassified Lactobacillus]WEV51299.1 tryptophan ABC transporter substrate-binding protein [Lactobacillus sp. ESL0700]WEV62429.1 tryptophan ABC transporter substrate-binding protein [Lactobacillus sp. ESL0731]
MKRMLAFISAILLFLGVDLVVAPKAASQTNQTAPKTEVVHVGILQMMTHPALDQIHQGVVAGLKEEGLTTGKNLKIDFLNAQGDQSNLKTMSQQLANKDSLLVGIATPAAQALANSAPKTTPIILAGISTPATSGLVKSEAHPGGNITGTSGLNPVTKQFELMHAVMPHAKKIGIIYTSSDHGGQTNAHAFARVVKQAGLIPKLYTISNTNDLQQVASQMVSQVDMVYAPQDNGVASAMKTLVNVANNVNIPVFPCAETMVPDGGLASYVISQKEMGRVAGVMAAKVLRGKNPATYPVATVKSGYYMINKKEMRKLHIKIPAAIMRAASQHGKVIK